MFAKTIGIDIQLGHNGAMRRIPFEGYAFVDAGFLVGTIIQDSPLLSRAEQVFLTAFTLTGCPLAAREEGETHNPWRLTGGEYTGERQLDGDGFSAKSRIVARQKGRAIGMDLSVRYDGRLPDFAGVAGPFQEGFRQLRQGELEGQFEIPFVTVSGETIPAQAYSRYCLNINRDVPSAWRNITILARPEGSSLLQIEQIDLFGDEGRAIADLRAKSDVAASFPLVDGPVAAIH